MSTFEIKDTFYLKGKPFQIISGSIHYFRIVPEYWRDRLEKLKSLGMNTVETYIPWNIHEPEKGRFVFEGMCDVVKFVKLAEELGLYAILRPSPYICAEWEFGGLPGWLLASDDIRLRVSGSGFLEHVQDYYNVLLPMLKPLQVTEGGNVILMQVENEYGYFGNDKRYLEQLRDMLRAGGITVPLITSDGPTDESIEGGKVEGALPTGNFGSHTRERFGVMEKHVKGGPLMCAEFWVGWFDHWGNGGHMKGNLEQSAADLEEMLKLGHVNIYMFIGGTNFGFMNGSNYYDELTPDVTSYDYDAVLTEAGDFTEKYRVYREIIGRYTELPQVSFSTAIVKKAYGTLKAKEKVGLFRALEDIAVPVSSAYTRSMEKLGQYYGYILYTTKLTNERRIEKLRLNRANDRANIFLEDRRLLNLYDRELLKEWEPNAEAEPGEELRILVENMGRVNFGPRMEEQRKGIDGSVQINGHMHHGWQQYCLPLDNLDKLDFSRGYEDGLPAFYRFELEVEEKGDTFLELEGWGKGCVFVNGFNVGRYWEIGPQKRLYIPAPLLKQGKNEIIVFETEGKSTETVSFCDRPDIG